VLGTPHEGFSRVPIVFQKGFVRVPIGRLRFNRAHTAGACCSQKARCWAPSTHATSTRPARSVCACVCVCTIHPPPYQQLMVTRFAASLRTANSPQRKEARPLSHALTYQERDIVGRRVRVRHVEGEVLLGRAERSARSQRGSVVSPPHHHLERKRPENRSNASALKRALLKQDPC
jgi:hypothetical protein